jgi:hypothetical protein
MSPWVNLPSLAFPLLLGQLGHLIADTYITKARLEFFDLLLRSALENAGFDT